MNGRNRPGRTYLVTGSSSGLGAFTRRRLLSAGHHVVGVDLDPSADIALDLADPRARGQLAVRLSELGVDVLDGVLPSAGVSGRDFPAETVIRLNYFGAVSTVEQCLALLVRSPAPRVCLLSSIGMLALPEDAVTDACASGDEEAAVEALRQHDPSYAGHIAYANSKRAIAYYVRRTALRPDVLGARVLVNAVAPALIATAMTARTIADPATLAATLESFPQPLGVGEPNDVASLVDYLLSVENNFITGQTIFVDGGHEALRGAAQLPIYDGSRA